MDLGGCSLISVGFSGFSLMFIDLIVFFEFPLNSNNFVESWGGFPSIFMIKSPE